MTWLRRKVGPAEVEDALMEHPGVAEAAVIGVRMNQGETIVGFVVLKNGVELRTPCAMAF